MSANIDYKEDERNMICGRRRAAATSQLIGYPKEDKPIYEISSRISSQDDADRRISVIRW